MYLNTKYLTKAIELQLQNERKRIEILNNYSRKCKYISDTF